ncbi:MAG TPA: hypothetical protein P5205_17990 [Candidatus Paceibacterota bacterium]|nr:hypothetical protein [Verrucomicrobiota bacterium]HSA12255.1 hypothetical protein [Candidatus Paceibacterota bacterium]
MKGIAGLVRIRGVVLYTGTEIIPFAGSLHGLALVLLWTGRSRG